VIFLRSHILGFGKLGERMLDFQSGLNLVFSPNEGGKSTLQRFLVGLLYGQLRSDLRFRRRLDPWVEQYKPWHGTEYGGILWCRLADSREVEIHRFFGKEESRIEIRTSAGEDITGQYEQQRNGEVLFAPFHFGIPKELFQSVGMIRENRVAEIHGYETIRDRIANLAQSGDEELSIQQSLAHIQEKLDSIGSERAPTKPYKQTMELMQALRDERKAADERRNQLQDYVKDRNRLAGEVSELECELSKIQAALLSARRREMAAKIESMEKIEGDLRALRTEIESLGAHADFPADRLDELNQLVGARDSIAKHLDEVRSDEKTALAQLSRADSEKEELAAYASFSASTEAEKITECFVSYLSTSLQKDGVQRTINRLQGEAYDLGKRLGELSSAFKDPKIDWQRIAREAAEDEQTASRDCEVLTEGIAKEKSNFASKMRMALYRRVIAGALLVLAIVPLTARLFPGFDRIYLPYAIGFTIILAGAAAILLFSASKSAEAGSNTAQILENLENELKRIREEGGQKRKKLNEVITDSGFHELDDFLEAAKRSEQDRHKLEDIQTRLAESDQQLERIEKQSGELFQSLKDGLAKVDLACSPGNLKFQIDAMRANLRRYRELDSHHQSCTQKVESLKVKDAALANEQSANSSQIQTLLDQARVGSPEEFRAECSKRQRLLELREREASRNREFEGVAGDRTLSQWKALLKDLTEKQKRQHRDEGSAPDPEIDDSEGRELYLPYLPTISEAEEKEKRVASRLSSTREEYARAVERTDQAFQNLRPSSEIDEDLAIAEQRFQGLERNRLALGMALDILENLSRQQQEILAPQLNSAVEQRFLRLCGGRYEEVKIDPDFQVWVREIRTGELRRAEHLSRGTQDQLYFSVRFGVLDLISNAEEPCPSLLDEPFAAYDRTRLCNAFEVLTEEAKRRQLFLFTCREDLLDLARQCEANIIQLEDIEKPRTSILSSSTVGIQQE
jgi:DNA repair exonuclease SbcCD ATPase subunit